MKVARWILGAVVALLAIYVGLLLLTADMDVVTSTYGSLNEARAGKLVARGWLPDILPASARDIRTSNNVDLNTSEGEFRFLAADYPAFASRLSRYTSPHAPDFVDEYLRRMQAREYETGFFSDEESTWLFACQGKDGYCEYTMWVDRVQER
jgi:hypothetical protein